MSTNISKQKREDLLIKIKEIRTFISSAPQDENARKLLAYLSDLEKDVMMPLQMNFVFVWSIILII